MTTWVMPAGEHIRMIMRRRFLLLSVLIGGVLGMLVATNISIGPLNIHAQVERAPRGPLLLCALLLIANEGLKGLRWGAYLHAGGVRVRLWDAVCTHLASQAINVIPGNDWLAARLVEEHQNGKRRPKMRQAAPAVVTRWVCDCLALSLIVTFGVWHDQGFVPYTLLPIPIGLTVAALFRAKTPARWIARQLARWPKTQKLVRSEAEFHRSARRVMRPQVLVLGTALSGAITMVSALTLYVIAQGFGCTTFGIAEATMTHALTTLASMVSFIPNGFGVADGSLAGWMHHFNIGGREIVIVTLTLRLANIVVRSAAGIAMLLARYRFMWEGGTRQFMRRIVGRESLAIPVIAAPLATAPETVTTV